MVKIYFQMLKGSLHCSQWWDLTDPYFNVCPDNQKGLKNQTKKIHSKLRALEWSQHFSHYQSMEIYRCSRAAYSTVQSQIWPNFEPIREFMSVHVACKNEEDPTKSKGTGVATTFIPLWVYGDFSRCLGQLTHKSLFWSCRISNSSKLLWLSLLHERMKKI